MHLWSGYTMLRRGELAEAERLMGKGLEELRIFTQSEISRVYNAGFMAAVKYEQGGLDAAWRELGDSPDTATVEFDASRHWLRAKVALLTASDRLDEALELSEEYGRRAGRLENPAWVPWRSLQGLVLHRLGRAEEAIELVQEELRLARRWGAGATVGRTLRILGMVDRSNSLAHLTEAVEVLEATPAKLELAKALGAYGGTLRRVRQPSEAREPLRRALELADVCGATRFAEQMRSELYASGSRPRATAMSGAGALTASERRVADLAASGQSNRDIAQVLFVTPKTVEVHLSNTYRKLGIRSRRDLPSALAA
jgi:ATP/maltotriose-dependent transcriptional regulator MalT